MPRNSRPQTRKGAGSSANAISVLKLTRGKELGSKDVLVQDESRSLLAARLRRQASATPPTTGSGPKPWPGTLGPTSSSRSSRLNRARWPRFDFEVRAHAPHARPRARSGPAHMPGRSRPSARPTPSPRPRRPSLAHTARPRSHPPHAIHAARAPLGPARPLAVPSGATSNVVSDRAANGLVAPRGRGAPLLTVFPPVRPGARCPWSRLRPRAAYARVPRHSLYALLGHLATLLCVCFLPGSSW